MGGPFSQSLLGRGQSTHSPRATWEGLSRKGGSQLCYPRDFLKAALSPRQARKWGFPVSPEAPAAPLSHKQASYLKDFFLLSVHLLVVPSPFYPMRSLDSRPTGPPSGPSRLPEAALHSQILSIQPARAGELGFSRKASALALPASSPQVKGHQASALGPPAIRPVPYPPLAPLARGFPEHFALVGEVLRSSSLKTGQRTM